MAARLKHSFLQIILTPGKLVFFDKYKEKRGFLTRGSYCSDFRPVPSHQEVFMAKDNGTDSLVIEINEMAPGESAEDIMRYHFEDIGQASDAIYEASSEENDVGILSTTTLLDQ